MKIELSSLIVVLMGLTSSVLAKNHDRYSYGPCTSDNEGAYACCTFSTHTNTLIVKSSNNTFSITGWSNAFGEKHDKVVVCNSGKWETEQKCELYHSCLTEG